MGRNMVKGYLTDGTVCAGCPSSGITYRKAVFCQNRCQLGPKAENDKIRELETASYRVRCACGRFFKPCFVPADEPGWIDITEIRNGGNRNGRD